MCISDHSKFKSCKAGNVSSYHICFCGTLADPGLVITLIAMYTLYAVILPMG